MRTLFQQVPWTVWLPAAGGLLLVSVVGGVWHAQRRTIADLKAAVRVERALRDTARFREAATSGDRDRYRQLYETAKARGGTPVGGATVVIRQRDTVVVHDTLRTVVVDDSTRIGTFRDSTNAGVLDGTVVAPPCCAPLQVRYTLTRPPIRADVGFIRVGQRTLATVYVDGDSTATVEAPFFAPPAPRRWTSFAEVVGDPDALTVRVGSQVRVWRAAHAVLVADRRFEPNRPGLVQAGVRWIW